MTGAAGLGAKTPVIPEGLLTAFLLFGGGGSGEGGWKLTGEAGCGLTAGGVTLLAGTTAMQGARRQQPMQSSRKIITRPS